VFILFTVSASAQKERPWTEWSEKDAMKVMTDSAWAQTQKELSDTDTPTGPITAVAGKRETENTKGTNAESGESIGRKTAALTLNYRVAFLSAKPVRQAFVRFMEIKAPETPADKAAERRAFIDKDFSDYIVVILKLDGTDRDKLKPALALLSGDPKAFKDTAYLERKDGKRLALMDYRVPDQLGAKFIFPRTLEGKPFLDASSGEVRFYVELGKTKLSRRFKVADMMFDGKLEY